mgnify:CR=1 FL=1
MSVKKVGIIGLGNVGEAVVRSFKKNSSLIAKRTSVKVQIAKVCDLNKAKAKVAKSLKLPFSSNPYELIDDPQIDIIVELIGGIEPANTLITKAIKSGKSVVTANKALLAQKGKQLFSLAKSKKACIGFEASVCGAIPIIRSISAGLIGCQVKRIDGILNGTTNYILDKMEKDNSDFAQVLSEAQKRGLAEQKSDLDIKGIDALHKLCILSYLCYGVWPSLKKVYAEGISKISLLDILYAKELNYKIKLLAIAKKEKNSIDLRVHPALISSEHPLSGVSLAYNAVFLDTQPAGQLLFYGEGAGGVPTSSSVISDIVNIACEHQRLARKEEKLPLKNIKDVKARYYMRVMAQDHPGVLAKVSEILASFKISIASVNQKEKEQNKVVPVVMITHEVKEGSIRKAVAKIDKLSVIKGPSQIIRIEDL